MELGRGDGGWSKGLTVVGEGGIGGSLDLWQSLPSSKNRASGVRSSMATSTVIPAMSTVGGDGASEESEGGEEEGEG